MGLFDDILKGLPENAVLRSKVAEFEAKQAALETENAILKDDLRQAKAEVVMFKDEIDRLTHNDDLVEIERNLLVLASQEKYEFASQLAEALGESGTKVEYYFQELKTKGYLRAGYSPLLTQRGRKFLIDNNLLE